MQKENRFRAGSSTRAKQTLSLHHVSCHSLEIPHIWWPHGCGLDHLLFNSTSWGWELLFTVWYRSLCLKNKKNTGLGLGCMFIWVTVRQMINYTFKNAKIRRWSFPIKLLTGPFSRKKNYGMVTHISMFKNRKIITWEKK